MSIHIYREATQPATNYTDPHTDPPMKCGMKPEAMVYTECCGGFHPAKFCVVQCYYDGLRVWCERGHGCKDPVVIAAKKAREFANRSKGQKERWSKARRK